MHASTARSRRSWGQYSSHSGAPSTDETCQAMESQTRNGRSTPSWTASRSGLNEPKFPDPPAFILNWTEPLSLCRTVPISAFTAIAAIRPSRNAGHAQER